MFDDDDDDNNNNNNNNNGPKKRENIVWHGKKQRHASVLIPSGHVVRRRVTFVSQRRASPGGKRVEKREIAKKNVTYLLNNSTTFAYHPSAPQGQALRKYKTASLFTGVTSTKGEFLSMIKASCAATSKCGEHIQQIMGIEGNSTPAFPTQTIYSLFLSFPPYFL